MKKRPDQAKVSINATHVVLSLAGKDYEIEPGESKRLGEALFKSGCQVELHQQGK